jgi:hypothetical protein
MAAAAAAAAAAAGDGKVGWVPNGLIKYVAAVC